MGAQFGQHLIVLRRLNHNRYVLEILGRCAEDRRPADVNHLNSRLLLERVEVNYYEVYRLDLVLLGLSLVLFVPALVQYAAVYARVQGLHAALEELRKARDVRDIGNLQAGLAQSLGSASRRYYFNAELCKLL